MKGYVFAIAESTPHSPHQSIGIAIHEDECDIKSLRMGEIEMAQNNTKYRGWVLSIDGDTANSFTRMGYIIMQVHFSFEEDLGDLPPFVIGDIDFISCESGRGLRDLEKQEYGDEDDSDD